MASCNQMLASMARPSLPRAITPFISAFPRSLAPSVAAVQMVRHASGGGGGSAKKPPKKRTYKFFRSYDLSGQKQYSLYLRACEVGRPSMEVKYELAVKLRTHKNGPVVRDRIRLPHPVKTDTKVAVICPENGSVAAEARALGAVAAGQESLISQIQEGNITFNRLICHTSSEIPFMRANLGKILGPKGLMPSLKTKTITNNIRDLMRELVGSDEYRERNGVVRLAVGQLGFTPEMLAENIKSFVARIKSDMGKIDEQYAKSIDEVVLSSTKGPGFSLNGGFNPTDPDLRPEDLTSPM
ncbi:hypothetical protein P8C59_008385 [Phyllachora maydis]|uniref:Ribosomal protein L1 n=1 Tax=Phyllachora maydis TaxID=1825666 RepID=A0AAD9IC58_9PEZI|nr:hypothetical protein P8C59_008385 [Phyllachora maydis]